VSLEVSIPALGESVSEGTIARWLKQDGDTVKADEPLFELETDKATMEIPAPAAGRLEIVEREGATVRVGTVVARIAEAGRSRSRPPAPPARSPRQRRCPPIDRRLAAATPAPVPYNPRRRPPPSGRCRHRPRTRAQAV
jgi:pyruvate/2-oxoglutarate dehydrogenase complex dihydrolipoamide acyltransferase (E2) component